MRSLALCLPCAIILTVLSTLHYVQAQDLPTAQTSLGTVIGQKEILTLGTAPINYYSYRGIKYATATRFKAPTAVKAWSTPLAAKTDGPICIQTMDPSLTASLQQSEDCLYLNIYSPILPTDTQKLPVLVFIHGGGFSVGAGSWYGPELFMAEGGAVLVTFNYRVGVFGFLSTGTKDAQGNAGMKDQVEALKFIKNQITNFGGDPNSITIFGESAGAVSVIHHVLSPMSKGLFNRAIAQSGSALSDWANIESSVAAERANIIARNIGCDTQNTTTMVTCLSTNTVSALVTASMQYNIMSEQETMESDGVMFSPVIETEFDEEVFLGDYSMNLANSLTNPVPLIIGTNKDEGMLFLSEDDKVYAAVDRNLKYAVPRAIRKVVTSQKLDEYGKTLRDYYFKGATVSKSTLQGYVDLYTDETFMYPTVQTIRKLVEKKSDVYLYHFSYSGGYKMANQIATNLKFTGVNHGEEIGYLLFMTKLNQDLTKITTADYKTAQKMVRMWKSFAKTGVPTSSTDDILKTITWTKITDATKLNYLDIGADTTETQDYYKERIAIWDGFSSGLQDFRTAQTSLGTVIGKKENFILGTETINYYSYRGVKYATATRFKAPTAVKAWSTPLAATTDGPICIQTMDPSLTGSLQQSEDCLYLNIYSPILPTDTPKLPVLVFIHGGGFSVGAGSWYGPQLFMAEGGAVLVTFNYRVGVFGFLSTGTKDAQGNAGMKDQVAALKFIKNQITNFGGDPNSITIFGESAGAVSVIHHVLSPMSKGLFNRAIAQSGSALSDWANIESSVAAERAHKIARNIGCDTQNTTTMVTCLSTNTVSALVTASMQNNIMSEQETMESDSLVFSPVIETKFDEEVFLGDYSMNLANSLTNPVPLIIGTNKDEGMLFLSEDDKVYAAVDRNLKYAVPRAIRKVVTSQKLDEYGKTLRDYYFNGATVSKSTLQGYVNLYTDEMFMYPTVQTIRKLVEKKSDVYLYHFSYSGGYKMANQIATNLKFTGVNHGEEIGYLLVMAILNQDLTKITTADYQTAQKMVRMWKSFAKTGVPTSSTDAILNTITWTKITNATNLNYLDIGATITETQDYYKERIAVWDGFSSGYKIQPTILLTLLSLLAMFRIF